MENEWQQAAMQQAPAQKMYAGAQIGGSLNTKAQSPLSRLIEAVDYLEKAASNVCDIANTIAGAVPIAGASATAPGYGDGLMAAVEMQAERINALTASIMSDTQRTRSRL